MGGGNDFESERCNSAGSQRTIPILHAKRRKSPPETGEWRGHPSEENIISLGAIVASAVLQERQMIRLENIVFLLSMVN